MIFLLFIVLLQMLLTINYLTNISLYHDYVFFNGFPVHLVVIVILNLIALYILWKINKKESEQLVKETESTHEEQFQRLVTSIRSDRHDLNNHLTVISGLVKIGSIYSLEEYIKRLVGDIQINNQALKVNSPILASMLYSKMSLWHSDNVQLEVHVETEEIVSRITSTDLIRLVGNLLDNAYDAALEMPEYNRKIIFKMVERERELLLIVENSSTLSDFDQEYFKMGTTSKSSHTGRGYGLAIIKEILNKYKANLHVETKDQLVTFTIKLLK